MLEGWLAFRLGGETALKDTRHNHLVRRVVGTTC